MKVLVTGAAGFIGARLCGKLLERGDEVVGVDNINDYYDINLKTARLQLLVDHRRFKFIKLDIADGSALDVLFQEGSVQRVVNLAAQAGVRYSLINPHAYVSSNFQGFMNVLECCRHHAIEHLVYASSSSVYGANTRMPFSVHDNVDHPVSIYAASKKANELMAHSYSHLFQLPTTGLRFFTVYGPWGRPDMSPFIFARNILEGKPIDVYNYGNHRRDFTYIDDIVDGIIKVLDQPAQPNTAWTGENPDPGSSSAPYRVYNIGCNQPVHLLTFIEALEKYLGKTAIKNLLPMQPGDVPDTYADVSDLIRDFGYKPSTQLDEGVRSFVNWYLDFYGYAKP